MMNLREISNNYLNTAFSKVFVFFSSFIASIITARVLGPELRGQYAYIGSSSSILCVIVGLAFFQIYPNLIKKKYSLDLMNRFFSNSILMFGSSTTLFFIGICLFRLDGDITIIGTFAILLSFSSNARQIMMIERINTRNRIDNLVAVARVLALALILVLRLKPYISLLILLYAIEAFYVVCFFIIFRPKFAIDFSLMKYCFSQCFYPLATAIFLVVNYQIDIVILKQFRPLYEVGIYSLAVTICNFLWLIPDSMKEVLFNRNTKRDAIKSIIISVKLSNYIVVFGSICFIFLGRAIIDQFWGRDFVEAYSSTVILFFGIIPMISFKMINTLYISRGEQKLAFVTLAVAAAANVALNLLLIPSYGAVGAACSSAISYSFSGIIYLRRFTKEYKLNIFEVLLLSRDDIAVIREGVKNAR
jgi:O-antigen/teichoic acid export membrane protein